MNIDQCTKCSHKDKCEVYAMLNSTLQRGKKHLKVIVNIELMAAIKDYDEFPDDWKNDIIVDITQNVAVLADTIIDKFKEYENDIVPLRAHIKANPIPNKRAFNRILKHIEETHD